MAEPCSTCGRDITDDAAFCRACGAARKQAAPPIGGIFLDYRFRRPEAMRVIVSAPFATDSVDSVWLRAGDQGTVQEFDSDGDVRVVFDQYRDMEAEYIKKENFVNMQMLDCPEEHGLISWLTDKAGWRCSKCKKTLPRCTHLQSCRQCNYDVCPECLPERRPLSSLVVDAAFEKVFPSLVDRVPAVTDQFALAAHEFWHQRTDGHFAVFLSHRDDPLGMSGALMKLTPLESHGKVHYPPDGFNDGFVNGLGQSFCGARLVITFLHRFVKAIVEFQVLRIAPHRFEVKVLNCRREDKPIDIVNAHYRRRLMEEKAAVDRGTQEACREGVQIITMRDILEGRSCADATRIARSRRTALPQTEYDDDGRGGQYCCGGDLWAASGTEEQRQREWHATYRKLPPECNTRQRLQLLLTGDALPGRPGSVATSRRPASATAVSPLSGSMFGRTAAAVQSERWPNFTPRVGRGGCRDSPPQLCASWRHPAAGSLAAARLAVSSTA
eukprot:TRINITY_DN112424_c0_g1_i1.p1 TRINITY_DN112424_c0_g1~~TRINITY_DN112424_c0_g1_i1.p1  ORF type:complete len:498 (+),score=100.58 TRINITY_DN112424_c0_g1_i1:156-1649(+)